MTGTCPEPGKPKYETYKADMHTLLDLSYGSNDAELWSHMRASRKPHWEEDYKYYLDQKAVCSGSESQSRCLKLGAVDKVTADKQEKAAKRKEERQASQSIKLTPSSIASTSETQHDSTLPDIPSTPLNTIPLDDVLSDSDDISDDDSDDAEAVISKKVKYSVNKKPDTVTLKVPRKDLGKKLASMNARCRTSVRQSVVSPAALITHAGGNVKDFKGLSKSSFQRQRRKAEQDMAVKLIDEFVNDPDVEFYSVHWDSKKVELADGTKEERFVVCLKPIDADKPAQFIAAPRTPDGTGLSAKNATVRVLVQHGIPLPKVKLMGFDTTASNSGRKMGAAVRIEDHISGENGGEPLLYGGCRRHSAERHITWADDALRNVVAPGGEDPWFQRYKNFFPNIQTSD